jgi:hypothetical protein
VKEQKVDQQKSQDQDRTGSFSHTGIIGLATKPSETPPA